ncbi:MAG: TetR/AcrR family transcriptional regulator C-terminal domain-containing protein [Mobilitalea sp.]
MKHETTTLMTKKALAASLKRIMEQKPLGKISVREIIEDCGVNRKTFYYHFQDIYDLLKWIFEEEAIGIVKKYDLVNDYPNVIRFVLDYVEENKLICNCAFDALGRDELKRFFQKDFYSVVSSIVEQLSEGLAVPEDYKSFLTNFYTEAIASLLIDWLRNKEHRDKQKTINYVSITLFGSMKQILEKAEREL